MSRSNSDAPGAQPQPPRRRPPIELGPFDLIVPVARGSTATVWRGVHRGSGAAVAIKVLTHHRWQGERRGGPLELEVRTLARLNHPAVVAVHDYGWLTDAVQAASGDALVAGCPYVVMDWHGGGTLKDFAPADFATVQAILLRLLDALAHVHARGLVHRDLKPANVLIGRDGVVLTDLGLAWSLTDVQDAERGVMGTPDYIAPEQVMMQPWQFGPWTDLYALGCLAWALTTGEPPFRRPHLRKTLYARLFDPLPPFRPAFEVPAGFEGWLRRLLVRDPTRRDRYAAHAALALGDLYQPPPGQPRMTGPMPVIGPMDDATLSDATVLTGSDTVLPGFEPTLQGLLTRSLSMPALDLSAGAPARPPVETPRAFPDWRVNEGAPRASFTDCGRGLTRLRRPTMCGRTEERDRLWSALRRTSTEGATRVAIIDGAAGLGKTRLAEWLCARAHELGLAETIWVGAALQRFQASRLWTMFARRVGQQGVSPVELLKHLTESVGLDESMSQIISDLSAVDAGEPADGAGKANEREGFRCTLEAVGLLARHRPVVIAVDDAHRDEVTLRFVNYALRRRPDLPVLFVLTLDRSAAEMEPAIGRAVDALSARFGAPILLGPLTARAAADIATQRLPLDPDVLDALSAASRGNPLYAAVMIQHWLDSGALAESSMGHTLRDGMPGGLPDGVVAAWSRRLEHLLSGLPESGAHALEIAAALGSPFARQGWFAACAAAGVPPPYTLCSTLIDIDVLTIASGDRMALGHRILARVLADGARRAGRWARWHGVCAELLVVSGSAPERIAHHLAMAGRHADAMRWWFEAIAAAIPQGNPSARRDLLRSAIASSRAMRVRRSSAVWARIKQEWARSRLGRGAPNALRHARQAAALAPSLVEAHAALAAELHKTHAWACVRFGQLDEADGAITRAEHIAQAIKNPRLIALNCVVRCQLASRRRDLEQARRFNDRGLALARQHAYRDMLAEMLNFRGELARWRGDLDAAEAAYREAERVMTSEEARTMTVVNLAFVKFEQGAFDAARREAERARWHASRLHSPVFDAFASLAMLLAAAPAADVEAWDQSWRATQPFRELKFCEFDIARTFDLAARAAWAHMPRRALDAARTALAVYRAISPVPELEALERWVAEVSSA